MAVAIDQAIVTALRDVIPAEQRASQARREVQRKLTVLKKQVRQHMVSTGTSELSLDGVGTFTLTEEEKVPVSSKALKSFLTESQYREFAEQHKTRVKRFKFVSA